MYYCTRVRLYSIYLNWWQHFRANYSLRMNPKTQTYNQLKMNDRELEAGVAGTKNSWHQQYRDSAWVFLGGLPYEMTEGDVICMMSQYGEVVHVNLIR